MILPMYQNIEMLPSIVLEGICIPEFMNSRPTSELDIATNIGLKLINTILFESRPI